MILSTERIQIIRTAVESSDISHEQVRENLVDHLCCAVESKMEAGKNFGSAFQDAINDVVPRGFKEIEIETNYLLNAKTIFMKKIKFGIALLGSMSFCFGIAAKTIHLSIGNDFLLFGLFSLTVGIPFLFLKQNSSVYDRVSVASAFASLLLTTIGFSLKMISSLGADFLMVAGSCLFALCFLPLYFVKLYRASLAN